jgi:hypothetical protein
MSIFLRWKVVGLVISFFKKHLTRGSIFGGLGRREEIVRRENNVGQRVIVFLAKGY